MTMVDMGMMEHSGMAGKDSMGGMDHSMRDKSLVPGDVEVGAGVDVAPMDRMDFPGLGLDKVPHRVLRYTDLKAKRMNPHWKVEREMEIHLTGNMERHME